MDRPVSLGARRIDLSVEQPFRLGVVRIDPRAHEISWGAELRRLQPLTMKVLVTLYDKRGEVVSREELVDRCWDGRFVGEDVINRAISLLRRVATDCRGFEIETVPRAGYRLVEAPPPTVQQWRTRAIAIATTVVLLIGVVVLGPNLQHTRQLAAPSITLLRLTLDTADPGASKLAAATHDAIAHTLSQGPFVVKTADSATTARSAAADFLMSGEVSDTPEKLVISIRMEDARQNAILFSHQFETPRQQASSLPEQIGAQVAAQLSWTAPLIALERRHSSDPAVIRALLEQSSTGLQGNGNLADFQAARRVASSAPDSPLAQIDLAYATVFALDELPPDQVEGAVALGRRAADRALALAPESGEAYAPWCMLHSEQLRIECEDRLRKAVRIDPDAPFAPFFLARLILNPVGRNKEAADIASASLAHDPYMPGKISLMLQMLEVNGRAGEAEQLYRESLGWWPDANSIARARLTGIIQRGDFQAAERFEAEIPGQSNPVLFAINTGSIGKLRTACSGAKDLEEQICMLALARFGDLDRAFAIADKLYPSRRAASPAELDRVWLNDPEPNSTAFLNGPAAAPLRKDPRFLAIAERVGLLDYWRSGRFPDFCTYAHEPECGVIMRR